MTFRGLTALSFAMLFLCAAILPAQEVNTDVKPGRHNNEERPENARQERLRNLAVADFVAIKAGEFAMGSETGGSDEKPQHRVRITKGFELGKFEVTQGQWQTVMGANPSHFKGDNRPVDSVSWNDVQEFLKRLNAMQDGYRYRLPTEAEWEYAERAGSAADAVENLDTVAWYYANSDRETHPVGSKRPNAWGLYDMLGNVWEWCGDWYSENYYASSPVDDPQGPASGSSRVVRGGSWNGLPRGFRLAYRGWTDPDDRGNGFGFRLVREGALP